MQSVHRTLEEPTGLAQIDLIPYMSESSWILTRVIVPKEHRQSGIGSDMLKEVCSNADLEKISLMLELRPYGDESMTKDQLRDWYARFGFKSYGGFMKRFPK